MFYGSVSLCDVSVHNEHASKAMYFFVSILNAGTQRYLSLKQLSALLFGKRALLRVDSTFYPSVIKSTRQDVGTLFPVQLRNSQRT
jgi:hypothetical protein